MEVTPIYYDLSPQCSMLEEVESCFTQAEQTLLHHYKFQRATKDDPRPSNAHRHYLLLYFDIIVNRYEGEKLEYAKSLLAQTQNNCVWVFFYLNSTDKATISSLKDFPSGMTLSHDKFAPVFSTAEYQASNQQNQYGQCTPVIANKKDFIREIVSLVQMKVNGGTRQSAQVLSDDNHKLTQENKELKKQHLQWKSIAKNMQGLQEEIKKLTEENEKLGLENEKVKEENKKLRLENERVKEENEKWKLVDIPFDDITLGERIGEGGFGEVLKAQWHGQSVVVKRIKHSALMQAKIENLIHESRTVMRMHHKHVILSMGTTQAHGAKEIMLVMEYMKHGSMQDLLFPEEGDPVKLTPSQVVQIALDVAKGLNYLHCLTPKIIHMDLKCDNILLYHKKTRAKISDFGTARYLNKNSMRKTFQGTIGYIAPEVWEEEEHNEKADVYSFGIVLLVMLTSNQNLPMTRDPIKLRTKINGMLEAVVNSGHDALKKLILDCCHFNPKERPSMKECIEVLKSLRRIYARSNTNND